VPLSFGDYVLDLGRRELSRDGAITHTRPKVFDILCYLVANRDRVLSRDELLTHGWPGLTVSDATLSSCIRSVRQAIGDDGSNPKFIKTLRGQGFRFIADVAVQNEPDDGSAPSNAKENEAVESGVQPIHARENSLAIAVLPFANLNNDPTMDYLSEGLAEDITTELSRFKAFTVIARNSSFHYRDLINDIPKIAAELRVDYILEGSVRCDDDVFRATAQLIHAPTTKQLWAENYDGEIGQLFALQDEISQKIATNIKPEIDMAEIRRASTPHSGDLRAQEMAWRARALMDKARMEASPTLYDQAIELAEDAAAQDPRCRQAWWTISVASHNLAFGRHHGDTKALLKRSREAAEKLRALDRNDHSAYLALGWIGFIERDFESGLANLSHAHELNPNCTMTLMQLGVLLTALGKADIGYEHLCRAVRLSPRDLWLGFMFAAQGFACYALERYQDGIEYMRRAIQREPQAPANHVILAACLVEIGDLEEAGAAIRAQRGISEDYFLEYLEGKRLPYQVPEIATRYAAALRRAADAA
jgi:TolB-like protein